MELDTNPGQSVADRVWAKPLTELTDLNTVGGHLAEAVLTVAKFIGLK
jgi:hypothetical protein